MGEAGPLRSRFSSRGGPILLCGPLSQIWVTKSVVVTLTSSPMLLAHTTSIYFADLVLADMTIANSNVYYEVGIRHAAKEKGCVLLAADWSRQLFDVVRCASVDRPDRKSVV